MSILDHSDIFRKVIEALPVGVWITDEAGKILYGNLAGRQLWGGARPPAEHQGWLFCGGKRITAEEWVAARALREGDAAIDEEVEIECQDGTGLRQAALLAERLRACIATAGFDTVARVTCSFGVCGFGDEEDADALVRRADDLMYQARRAGRSSVVVQ